MSAILISVITILIFIVGYNGYGKFLERIFRIDARCRTPAEEYYDGVDYVPAKHWSILFGHHFASIAGAGPIIGPVIATAMWGWGAGLLWIIIGTIFIGGVHDFGALVISVKNKGNSLADISGSLINKRMKLIFSIFIWLALLLVIAVFVYLCAQTFISEPKIVLPSLGLIPVAVLVGIMLYRFRVNQIITTLIGVGLLGILIFAGNFFPIQLSRHGFLIWVIILFIYSYIASITPVNILLQPRDYISSFLLIFGIIFGFLGILLTNPQINTPVFIKFNTTLGNLWPMLFVVVACGAVSGFHSLIAAGTTSKQLSSERDARKIGYGGMIFEGVLALLAVVCVSAGLGSHQALLTCINTKASGPIQAFALGFGTLTEKVFGSYGRFIATVILNAFILTTLDTATRIGRYITEELTGIKNKHIASMIIIVFSGMLALSGKWTKLWPAFGAANQLIAALSLLIITIWIAKNGQNIKVSLIPAIFMSLTTLVALGFLFFKNLRTQDYLLVLIAGVLIVLAIIIFIICSITIYSYRKKGSIC
ncbi:MAG: carbon starvation protein A [Candidatus Omnitrophota bacterium]